MQVYSHTARSRARLYIFVLDALDLTNAGTTTSNRKAFAFSSPAYPRGGGYIAVLFLFLAFILFK